jgi:alpha-L-fucosidase
MRNRIAIGSILAGLMGAGWGSRLSGQVKPADTSVSAEERIRWFRHVKLGMFIHWGPYSLLAGEWKGQRVPAGDEAEWIMQRFNIPVKEYREMARRINPSSSMPNSG